MIALLCLSVCWNGDRLVVELVAIAWLLDPSIQETLISIVIQSIKHLITAFGPIMHKCNVKLLCGADPLGNPQERSRRPIR